MKARGISTAIVAMLVLMLIPTMPSQHASAAPATQQLYPDSDLFCDMFVLRDNDARPVYEIMKKTVPRAFGSPDYDVGTSTGDYPNYYDDLNRSTPGQGWIHWPNYSATTPTTGQSYVRLGLSDPVGELADWYTVNVRVYVQTLATKVATGELYHADYVATDAGLNVAVAGGVGYGATTGYTGDWSGSDYEVAPAYANVGRSVSAGVLMDHAGVLVSNIQNNQSGTPRPFSLAEVQNMYVYMSLLWTDQAYALLTYLTGTTYPYTLGSPYIDIQIVPASYTPPAPYVPPTGSFILRPNIDVLNASWGAYPGTMDGMFDATNETTVGGDGLLTYAWTSYSYRGSWTLGFTDCPSGYIYATKFMVRPWVIAKSTTASTGLLQVMIYDSTARSSDVQVLLEALPTYYTNSTSTDYLLNPRNNATWSITDLNNLQMDVIGLDVGTTTGFLYVTQIAVLVTPVFSETSSWDFSSMVGWLGGHGILTIVGVFGFLILVIVPTMAVIAYKDGDDSAFGSVVHAAVFMVIGFGFFLVGLIG
jgi:hypothetical protein